MKIVDIRTTALSYRCDPPYGSAGGMQARRGSLLVEIETDERIIGIGEAGVGGGATAGVIEKLLQPMLIGEDPLLIEGLWQKMFARTRQYGRRGVVMNAISGIDIALWDIAGKTANLPVYRVLGACRERVEAYASGGFYQAGKSVDDLAGEAEGYRARGFQGMKMKVGRNPSTQTHLRHLVEHSEVCEVEPEEDIARVAAVRQALGPKAKLMVDVNCAWSPSFAIEMGRAFEPYKLYWIEEPVSTDDIDGSARVAEALATPIAGYETEIGLYGFRELIRGARSTSYSPTSPGLAGSPNAAVSPPWRTHTISRSHLTPSPAPSCWQPRCTLPPRSRMGSCSNSIRTRMVCATSC